MAKYVVVEVNRADGSIDTDTGQVVGVYCGTMEGFSGVNAAGLLKAHMKREMEFDDEFLESLKYKKGEKHAQMAHSIGNENVQFYLIEEEVLT